MEEFDLKKTPEGNKIAREAVENTVATVAAQMDAINKAVNERITETEAAQAAAKKANEAKESAEKAADFIADMLKIKASDIQEFLASKKANVVKELALKTVEQPIVEAPKAKAETVEHLEEQHKENEFDSMFKEYGIESTPKADNKTDTVDELFKQYGV